MKHMIVKVQHPPYTLVLVLSDYLFPKLKIPLMSNIEDVEDMKIYNNAAKRHILNEDIQKCFDDPETVKDYLKENIMLRLLFTSDKVNTASDSKHFLLVDKA